jgi:hypothetical protein
VVSSSRSPAHADLHYIVLCVVGGRREEEEEKPSELKNQLWSMSSTVKIGHFTRIEISISLFLINRIIIVLCWEYK